MTKTLLCGVAAIAFTLAAPNAFAQDADIDDKAKAKAEQMMDATEEAAEDTMDAVEDSTDDMMDATDDMMDDAADEMDDAADDVENMMDDDMETMVDDMDVEVTVTPDSSVVADCPAGTEEQADGSCMVTGDWEPKE